jgi:hypothetical protein
VCKQSIRALAVRIGKIKPPVCFWHHPECFLPPTTLLAATDLGAVDALEQADRDLVQGRLDSVAAEREAVMSQVIKGSAGRRVRGC